MDGMEQNVKAGDVITMSAGCRHTVIAETELKLIEVQLGKEIDAIGAGALVAEIQENSNLKKSKQRSAKVQKNI